MNRQQQSFSLLEVMVVMTIFLVVAGAVFELLNVSQQRYRSEQQVLESFQGARLGMDLMVRDIHNAGYPPPYTFPGNLPGPPTPPAYPGGIWIVPTNAPAAIQNSFAVGVVGIAGGVVDPTCRVNSGINPCAIPNPWDVVLELDINPEDGLAQVEWVRYFLRRPGGAPVSTLFRAVAPKAAGANPAAAVISNIPFVDNVVQDPGAAVAVANPAVFIYQCDPSQIITLGGNDCLAEHVKTVYINLQVQGNIPDVKTGQFQRITVQGAASRLNPSR